MKRKVSIVTVLTALVMLASAVGAGAATDALPGSGWWTSFQIQNVGTTTGTIAFTAYWQVGQGGADTNTTYSQSGTITVTAGSAILYHPGLAPNYTTGGNRVGFNTADQHLPSGFVGGVVVSSDSPIVAIVSVGNNTSGNVGTAGGTASGFYDGIGGDNSSNTILFPTAKNNYFNQTTSFYIEAASVDATIVATFTTPAGVFPVTGTPVTIPAGKTYLIDPASSSMPSGNVAGALGSLTVMATSGQIAGTIIEVPVNQIPAQAVLATKGFGGTETDTTIFAPTNKLDYFGANTGWQLLNTTMSSASAVVTFTVTGVQPGSAAATSGIAAGMQFVLPITIDPGAAYLFNKQGGNYALATQVGGSLHLAGGVFFSGLAVANQPLVSTVNEANGTWRLVYAAFGAGKATTKLAAPLVKEAYFNQRTSLNVQNVGAAATDVTASYNCVDSTGLVSHVYTVGPFNVLPGAAKNFFRLSDAATWGSVLVPAGNICSVIVTSTGQNIVAVAQEASATNALDIKNYEAFNLAP